MAENIDYSRCKKCGNTAYDDLRLCAKCLKRHESVVSLRPKPPFQFVLLDPATQVYGGAHDDF